MKLAAYILPHQDDESFLIPKIRSDIADEAEPIFYFLTKSAISEEMASTRQSESKEFLSLLGVKEKNILFLGQTHSILDGTVVDHLSLLKTKLSILIQKHIDSTNATSIEIICPAFEGGHHDHDAAFILSRALAKQFNGPT
ncbi:MAG TPA: PIG-L family deacetylase, partial [Pseudobdellovibrionaceae bacterium]